MTLTRNAFIQQLPEITDELQLLFGKEDQIVIFDIGACEGEDAVRYSRLFPQAHIYVFEPRPDNLEKISSNLRDYHVSMAKVFDIALSSSKGFATFYLSSGKPEEVGDSDEWDYGNKSSSLLPPGEKMKEHTEWLEFKDTLEVKTERLDSFCEIHNISMIDFIHMDVQGAELMVLEGAGTMLTQIKAIWMEVEAVELYKGQPLKTDVEKFMVANNFVCVKSTVGSVAGDQLYVNKKLISSSTIDTLKKLDRRKRMNARIRQFYYRLRNKLSGN
ncbi:MAG: FkbM family methyltransferase [Flavobacteriales bacterium]